MKDLVDLFVDFKDKVWKNGRVEELSQLAKEFDFDFVEREKFTEQDYRIKEFKLFKNKKGIRFKGVLYRKDNKTGIQSRIYDSFAFLDGEEKKTTVIELIHPQLNVSRFEIRPKRTIKWAKEIIAREKTPFKDLARFNAFYEIMSPDIQNIQFEFNEVVLDQISNKKNIRLEGEGRHLIYYYKHKLMPLRSLLEEHQFLFEVASLLIDPPSEEGYV